MKINIIVYLHPKVKHECYGADFHENPTGYLVIGQVQTRTDGLTKRHDLHIRRFLFLRQESVKAHLYITINNGVGGQGIKNSTQTRQYGALCNF
jgi:hypothetical protein